MILYNSIFSEKFFKEKSIEINNYFKNIQNIHQKIQTLQTWYKDLQSGKVAKRTEEEQKSEFLDKVFGEVLGYDGNPNIWKLEKEYSMPDGSIADGLLGFFGVEKNQTLIKVAIEIKKLNINLDKPQTQREDNYTPVEQGFHYAYQAKETCEWVIISNFDEIRLYHHTDKNRYESFFFSELFSQENPTILKNFFYLLHYGQLFNQLNTQDEGSQSPTKKNYTHRLKRLEDITLQFYNDYKKYRNKLEQHIKKENKALNLPDYEILTLSNKIFDRLIFMRFVQAVEITHASILNDYLSFIRNCMTERPLAWITILGLFESFDKGYKNNIPPFNGELFKPIPILEKIVVKNEMLTEIMLLLASYDFKNELKVDILGHIFEHSLAELDQNTSIEVRSKDGVFYTPEHITDFIIQETLTKYLQQEKKNIYKKLKVDFISEFEADLVRWQGNNPHITRKKAIEIHADFYAEYKKIVQNIKILDPACGSGAFLTRVFDYLLKENELIFNEQEKFANNLYDELINIPKKEPKPKTKKALNSMFEAKATKEAQYKKQMSILGREIVKNNLFGVDINAESIEITKLSLWLKTANAYGITLANLQNNIQKGNSLIQDKNTDEKAFDWKNQSFDIIIGNPPYFSLSTQENKLLDFYQKNYQVFERTSDIYCLFFEKSLQLLKPNGFVGFITSKQWTNTNYGKKLRNFLIEKANPVLYVDFNGVKVFKDATVDSSILVIKNEPCSYELKASLLPNHFKIGVEVIKDYVESHQVVLNDLKAEKWIIAQENILQLKEKIKNIGSFLKDWNVKIFRGIVTGLNEAFIIDEKTKNELIKKEKKSEELLQPLLRGRDVHQYHTKWANLWVICTFPAKKINIDDYKAIKKHFLDFGKKQLEQSGDLGSRKKTNNQWFETQDATAYWVHFSEEKIIYPETTVRRSEFYLDKEGMYIDKTCFMITGEHLSFLNGVLTSSLMEWYLETELRGLGKNSIQYSKQYMENVPLPLYASIPTKLYFKIVEITEKLTDLSKNNLQESTAFKNLKKELDNYVFSLYGLNQEEIKICESI